MVPFVGSERFCEDDGRDLPSGLRLSPDPALPLRTGPFPGRGEEVVLSFFFFKKDISVLRALPEVSDKCSYYFARNNKAFPPSSFVAYFKINCYLASDTRNAKKAKIFFSVLTHLRYSTLYSNTQSRPNQCLFMNHRKDTGFLSLSTQPRNSASSILPSCASLCPPLPMEIQIVFIPPKGRTRRETLHCTKDQSMKVSI